MLHTLGGSMARIETGTNDSSTELPMNNTPQRKRWVAAASCVGLVAVIAGGGYWSNYVYLSDLTALDAWNRYMDLVKDGKYNDAVRYFPELATLFDGQFQHDFLRDAAHAHAPSKVTFEGRAVPNKSTEKEGIWTEIAGTVRFNDRASDSYSFSSYLKETTRRNGQLGMWKIDDLSYGSMTTSIDTDGLRSIRIGDILVSNPQGSYLLFPGSYRMEATPKNPDYWTINYEHPLADGAGEIRTNVLTYPFTIEPSEKLTQWIQTESEAFAASCRTGTPDPARQRTCGALAFSTEPLDLVNDPPFIGPLENKRFARTVGTGPSMSQAFSTVWSFTLIVGTGPTDPNAGKRLPQGTSFECRIDFAYDGATPTLECTLDK